MDEIKPCPFCGESVKVESSWWDNTDHGFQIDYETVFTCTKCKCKTIFKEPERFAVDKWNYRTIIVDEIKSVNFNEENTIAQIKNDGITTLQISTFPESFESTWSGYSKMSELRYKDKE